VSGDERSEEVVSAMPSAEREKCGAFFSRLRHNLLCSFLFGTNKVDDEPTLGA